MKISLSFYSLKMSSKSIISFLLIVIPIVNALPNIFCNPEFASMTRLVNDTYFIVDHKGNYWVASDSQKISISSSNGKVSQLVTQNKQKMQTFFDGFDLTFMINFDGKCHSESERLFGLYVSHSGFY
jgi:hypothetical protein